MTPTVSIIIVSYNTREETLDCLRSVHRETRDTAFEVIVIDNDSADGSAEAIAAEFPGLTLIANRENVGFGGANNIAARQARGEFVLLLNPDTVILDRAVDRLVAFARAHPDRGIWGGRTLFGDGTLNPTSCWRGMTLWGLFSWAVGLSNLMPHNPLFNFDGYGGWKRDEVREVDTVTGCFLLIRRTLWDELGGFDPDFYMYGEEADLCLRARGRGARPTITPEAEIIHYGGRSETVPADKIVRLMRAKVTLARKHWGAAKLGAGLGILRLLVGLRAAGYGLAARLGGARPGFGEKAAIWRSSDASSLS